MHFDILRDFYNENKKMIIGIVIVLIIMGLLKVVTVVRKNIVSNKVYSVALKESDDTEPILLKDYYEYRDYVVTNNIDDVLSENDFKDNDYILYYFYSDYCEEVVEFDSVKVKSSRVIINFNYHLECDRVCDGGYILFFIPVKKNIYDSLPKVQVEFNDNGDEELCEDMLMLDKPILYLYPTKEVDLSVKLEHPELLVTTYPKYDDGWYVHVMTNGDMYDRDGKYYYALYWDELSTHDIDFSEGFYVTKDNALEFLEEKLSIIGLNDREKNEFIMYWLPKLENNGQSLVYFELTDERESYNKLYISEKVDSLLRINMHIKKIDDYVDIKEEELTGFDRIGFVAVEWGGSVH